MDLDQIEQTEACAEQRRVHLAEPPAVVAPGGGRARPDPAAGLRPRAAPGPSRSDLPPVGGPGDIRSARPPRRASPTSRTTLFTCHGAVLRLAAPDFATPPPEGDPSDRAE